MTPRTTDDTSGLRKEPVSPLELKLPRGGPLRRTGAQADAIPPAHWPRQIGWKTLWDNAIGYQYRPHNPAPPNWTSFPYLFRRPSPNRGTPTRKAGTGERITYAPPRPAAAHRNSPTTARNHRSTDSGYAPKSAAKGGP